MSLVIVVIFLAFVVVIGVFLARFWRKITPWVGPLAAITATGTDWRRVIHTSSEMQLVTMSVPPGDELGAEVHPGNDQFFRVESGSGEIIIDGVTTPLFAGFAAIVPRGAMHNVKNTGSTPLKFYTIYAPPHHPAGRVDIIRGE